MTKPADHQLGDGLRLHHDMGRGPLQYRTDCWRFGVEQRNTKWHPEGESDWYAGWPAYVDRSQAEKSLRYYRDAFRYDHHPKYEHRICAYPPEPDPFVYRMERA